MQKMLSHFLHFFVMQCRTHKGGENYDVEKRKESCFADLERFVVALHGNLYLVDQCFCSYSQMGKH